jgi:hypothetical protein
MDRQGNKEFLFPEASSKIRLLLMAEATLSLGYRDFRVKL